MDLSEALKGGRLVEALAAAKDAVRKAPSEARHRSILFQLYCLQGNLEGAQTQLQLVGNFDVEATLWVGVCEKILACETSRRAVFAGQAAPTLFGKPPEWIGSTIEALRLGLDGNWSAAAASQAHALEAAPATAATINGQAAEWVADADSRLGPLLEAYIDGKYYWIPFEHIREVNPRGRTHFMDSIWAPADFLWLNEGAASGYVPVRYPDSETSADPQIQLGRSTVWEERAEGFFCGLGHRIFATNAADFGVGEIKTLHFAQPALTFATAPIADSEPAR